MYAANPDYVKSKYKLSMLREVENLVAEAVGVNVPFMNPITCVSPWRMLLCTVADYFIALRRLQWLLCLYAQGRYPREGYSKQPEHV